MNLSHYPQRQLIVWAGFFSLGKETNLEEGKINFEFRTTKVRLQSLSISTIIFSLSVENLKEKSKEALVV